MKKNHFLTILFCCSFVLSAIQLSAKPGFYLRHVIIVNGGQFESVPPFTDYVTVVAYDFVNHSIVNTDTIYTQSAQDILTDGHVAYVAAGDSIVKYDMVTLTRLAATSFGAPSTIKLAKYGNYLLAGNWYGSSDNNLRIFDADDLSFIDSIPEISYGAKDMVVVGDSLYIQQNLTSSMWTDSAGFLSVVDLTQLKYVRDIHFSNADEDLGRLHARGNKIIGLNSSSNTVTTYDVGTGASSTFGLPLDIQVGFYGQQSFLLDDTLFFKYNYGMATLNVQTDQLIDSILIDTTVTAFAVDSVDNRILTTQTDFASFIRGRVYDRSGALLDTLPVGFSPEAIGLFYDIGEGIAENAIASDINLYPNPTSGQITLEPLTDQPYQFQLYSSTGSLLLTTAGLRGKHTTDLGSYPPAVYLVRMVTSEGAVTKRIVKH